jgi:hypothetical protein
VDSVDVAQLIWDEIGKPSSWQAALPAGASSGATLAAPSDTGAPQVVVHPLARLSLRQKVAPLDVPISRLGGRVASTGTRSYHVTVTAPGGLVTSAVDGLFALAQYQDVSDDQKLTLPGFEPLAAGVTLTAQADTLAARNGLLATDVVFETLDVTSLDAPATVAGRTPAVAASALSSIHSGRDTRAAGVGWQVRR